MPCLAVLIAAFFPRIAIVLIVIFSDWLGRAYDTWIWPLLGFFLLPYTTLAYALAWHQTGGSISGFWLVLVIVAVLVDLAHLGGGGRFVSTGRRKHRS